MFISVADHGISPSSTVTRFVQAAGVPIQCSVAAGAMMFGDVHGGAGEEFARYIQELVSEAASSGRSYEDVATEYVGKHKRLDGFGHPQHPEGDPRGKRLFALAEEYGLAGDHIRMTRELEKALIKKKTAPSWQTSMRRSAQSSRIWESTGGCLARSSSFRARRACSPTHSKSRCASPAGARSRWTRSSTTAPPAAATIALPSDGSIDSKPPRSGCGVLS